MNISTEPQIEQHSLKKSVILHLWPGLVVSIVYLLLARPMTVLGLPAMLTLSIAYLIIIPAELGYMLHQGKVRTGRYTLSGIVVYRQRIPAWQYVVFIPALLLLSVGLFAAFMPLTQWTFDTLFASWVPDWVLLDAAKDASYNRTMLLVSLAVVFALPVVIYPIIEELYFRGFLMPRLSRFPDGGIILSSLLFGVYHFLEPWSLLMRFITLLPVLFVVWRIRNIYVVMVIHIIGNMAALQALAELL